MTIGIYLLYFDNSDKVYVGQSVDIYKRFRDHKSALRLYKHTNFLLQDAYRSYGEPKLQIIEECSISELDSLEILWTKEFNSLTDGLNIVYPGKGAGAGPNNHNSKYNKLQILRVFRKLYLRNNLTDAEIGNYYNVHSSTVTSIRLGNSHLWLKEEYPWQYSRIHTRINSKIPTPRNLIVGGICLKDPIGTIHHISNIREFAKVHGLDSSNISKVLNGKYKHTKNWKLP